MKVLLGRKNQRNLVLATYVIGKSLHYLNLNSFLRAILDKERFGACIMMINAAYFLGNIDLSESVMRYYPKFDKKKKKRATFWTFTLLAYLAIFLFILIFLLAGRLFASFNVQEGESVFFLTKNLKYTLLIFAIIQIGKMMKAWCGVLGKLIWPNLLQNILLELLVGGVIGLFYGKYIDYQGLLMGISLAYVGYFVCMIGYVWGLDEIAIGFDKKYLSMQFLREFLFYSFFFVFAGKMIFHLFRVFPMMLENLYGTAKMATYMPLVKLAVLAEIPFKVSRQSSGPLLGRLFDKNDYIGAKKIYEAAVFSKFFWSALFVFVIYQLRSFFGIRGMEEKNIFLLLGGAKILSNLLHFSLMLLVFSPYFYYGLWVVASGALSTIFGRYLILWWGGYGAAFGLLVAIFSIGIPTLFILWRQLKIHFFSQRLLLLFLAFLLVLGGVYMIGYGENGDNMARLSYWMENFLVFLFFLFGIYLSEKKQARDDEKN